MRTHRLMLAALAAVCLAAITGTAAAAPGDGGPGTTTVTSAAELQAAFDAAAAGGPTTVAVSGTIELDAAAVYRGTDRLVLHGPGRIVGTDPDADVIVADGGAPLTVRRLSVEGGRRGIVVTVPQDVDRYVQLTLFRVSVANTGYHGVQVIDGLVDLAAMGLGEDQVSPGADLVTEALVETEVAGGAAGSLGLVAEQVQVRNSGRAALDQDGLRIDERGDGGIGVLVERALFQGNGADGVELDEAGRGGVRASFTATAIRDNGDFDVDADPDDGLDVDEADAGGLYLQMTDAEVTANFDEGIDLDEAGDGPAVVVLTNVLASANVDENVKVTEHGRGSAGFVVEGGAYDGSQDASGILVEEFDAGTVDGSISGASITDNADSGVELLSVDLSADAVDIIDDADLPLPRDGRTGAIEVRDVTFAGNDDGAVDTFGVEVTGDVELPAFGPAEDDAAFSLVVLHVNDGESDLLGDEDGAGSISRFGTLLDAQRDALEPGVDRGVVAVTSGDNFLASPEFSASLALGPPYFDSIALDRLDFDAYAIGNHEFDFGAAVLAEVIDGIEGCEEDPFVSANLRFGAVPELQALVERGCIQTSTVAMRDGREIAIIGLTTPDLREVSSPGDTEILDDLAGIVNAEAAALADAGVRHVLLASHLQDIDEEVALAADLRGVDAIIGGGGGERLDDALTAMTADGVVIPIVTVPGDYFDLGRLVLDFDAAGALTGFDWDLLAVDGDLDEDPFLLAEVEAPVAAFVAELDEQIVTTSDVPLNGVRNDVRTRETNVGNLMADGYVDQVAAATVDLGAAGPIVGLQNGGGIRNDSIIPAGPVSVLDTFDIAPFTNFVSVLTDVAPADVVAAVEHGLAALPDTAGSFAQWSAGVRIVYDPAAAPGDRIVDLTLGGVDYVSDGALVADVAPVDVATIDFLAAGNDGYDVFEAYDFTRLAGVTYQSSLVDVLEGADLSPGSPEYRPREDVSLRTRIIPIA